MTTLQDLIDFFGKFKILLNRGEINCIMTENFIIKKICLQFILFLQDNSGILLGLQYPSLSLKLSYIYIQSQGQREVYNMGVER